MIFASGKGQYHYREVYKAALENNEIGVNKHTFQPTPPTSRLGFAGKKVSKKDKQLIAERLLQSALKPGADPQLISAALNMARFR